MKNLIFIPISIILWVCWWILAFLLITVLITVSFVVNKKHYNTLVIFTCSALTYSLFFFPILKIIGSKDLPYPAIYVPNHVSFFDLFICGTILPGYPRGIETVEHFSYPIYGWFITRFGEIPIETKTKKGIADSFEKVNEILTSKERNILIMPEGHRTRTGQLQEFKKGAFHLSKSSGIPIIPVVFKGLYERNNPSSLLIKPGFFDVILLEPVNPNEFENDTQMMNEVRDRMKKVLEI